MTETVEVTPAVRRAVRAGRRILGLTQPEAADKARLSVRLWRTMEARGPQNEKVSLDAAATVCAVAGVPPKRLEEIGESNLSVAVSEILSIIDPSHPDDEGSLEEEVRALTPRHRRAIRAFVRLLNEPEISTDPLLDEINETIRRAGEG